MKILHVVTSVDPALGGVAESIRSRGVKLVEMGHTVEVVSMDEHDAPHVANYPLVLHPLGSGVTAWQYHPGLVPWLKANCQRFDAVVIDGIWQYHGVATRHALKGTGVPYFVYPHGMLDPWFKRTYPLKHLKKWLFWPWADHRVLRDAKAVLFTCEEERRLAQKSFWLYSVTERIAPLGSATPPYASKDLKAAFFSEFPFLRQKQFLLFLSRVHPKKGCDILIDSFHRIHRIFPTIDLVIAGPGEIDYLKNLQKRTAELGIAARVHWVGMLQGEVKWGALCAANAFVLPSHQENFGIVVSEALACGTPVLITDKVNIFREIAEDNAGLASADDRDGVESLLTQWLYMQPTTQAEFGIRAANCHSKRYSMDAAAATFLTAIGRTD